MARGRRHEIDRVRQGVGQRCLRHGVGRQWRHADDKGERGIRKSQGQRCILCEDIIRPRLHGGNQGDRIVVLVPVHSVARHTDQICDSCGLMRDNHQSHHRCRAAVEFAQLKSH